MSGSRCVGHPPLKGASRRRSNSCPANIKKGTDASSCESHLHTAMGGRHHPAQQRQYYAKRRLAELRAICPDLPDDVLNCVPLRELSFAVQRAGRARQTALRGESKAHKGNGDRIHAQPEAEVCSTTEKSGQAHSQNSCQQPIAHVTSEHRRCAPEAHGWPTVSHPLGSLRTQVSREACCQ